MTDLVTQLNHDWTTTQRRPTSRWASEPLLRQARTCGQLIDLIRQLPSADADPHLLALARLAHHDELAARTLLQCVLPGLVGIISRTARAIPDRDERTATVLAHAWRRIRTYPTARRTTKVAANLLLDTLHDTTRPLRLRRPTEISEPEPRPQHGTPPDEARSDIDTDLHHLLTDALARRLITIDDHQLIYATRIHGIGLDQLAAQQRRHPGHLRRRRRQAEAALHRLTAA